MRGDRGFLYEEKCNAELKKLGILPGNPQDYGKNNDTDGAFKYDGRIYNIEYKYDFRADMGQASLGYNTAIRRWYVTGDSTAHGQVIQDLIRGAGGEDAINSPRGWGKKIPNKYTKDRVTLEEAKQDYKNFPDRYITINSNAVNSYYASKGKYYIQIGDLGFYYMSANPAGLDVPQFNPLLRVRFRLKAGGSGLGGKDYYNYRFTVALQVMTRPIKSYRDITIDPSFLLSKQK